MIQKVFGFLRESRAVAIGSVLAVAAVGMLVTVLLAGAIGRQPPQVAPIVIESSSDGESSDEEVGEVVANARGLDESQEPTPEPSTPEGTDSTASSDGRARSTVESTESGPVPTAPPPPPATAAPTAPLSPPVTAAPTVTGAAPRCVRCRKRNGQRRR